MSSTFFFMLKSRHGLAGGTQLQRIVQGFRFSLAFGTLALATACGGGGGDGSGAADTNTLVPAAASASAAIQVPQELAQPPFDAPKSLNVPPGFGIRVLARVNGARFMALAPNGDVLVSNPGQGKLFCCAGRTMAAGSRRNSQPDCGSRSTWYSTSSM